MNIAERQRHIKQWAFVGNWRYIQVMNETRKGVILVFITRSQGFLYLQQEGPKAFSDVNLVDNRERVRWLTALILSTTRWTPDYDRTTSVVLLQTDF
jgi:hypothetical protein